jgi:hypothetical protein
MKWISDTLTYVLLCMAFGALGFFGTACAVNGGLW